MKTQFLEAAEKKANAILARACRQLIRPAARAFCALVALVSILFLFSGCEMMQEVFVSPSNTSTNYSKATGDVAAATPTTPPPAPKKQAEFDAMMERLENRSPAPTITPRSEPVAAAVSSPKATASAPAPAPAQASIPTRVAAATSPSPQAEPLIIRAPPPPPRAGAGQLLATNPPPARFAESVVAAPPPPRAVQSLVVVGTHKPPPKTYGGWKTLLLITLVLLLASSFLLSFAPVRERLLTLKVAATVWWSTRKVADKRKPESKKGAYQTGGPGWIDTVKAGVAQAMIRCKALPIFGRGAPEVKTEAAAEQHRPTPAEMLLKKIGAPPSKDVSTSRSVSAHKPGETSSTLPVIASQPAAEKVETPPAAVSNQPEPSAAPVAASVEASAKVPAVAEEKPAQSRVNKVLQAPFTPAIITLMSPPPERPAAATTANSKPAASVTTGQAKPCVPPAAEKKEGETAAANTATPDSQTKGEATPTQSSPSSPRETQTSRKVDEPVTA